LLAGPRIMRVRVPLTSLGSIQTLDHPITHSPPDLAQTPTLPASHRHSDSCLPQSTICSSYHLIHHLSDLPCLLSLPDPHLSSKPLCNVKGYALDECFVSLYTSSNNTWPCPSLTPLPSRRRPFLAAFLAVTRRPPLISENLSPPPPVPTALDSTTFNAIPIILLYL
jgi:hypothetical protein